MTEFKSEIEKIKDVLRSVYDLRDLTGLDRGIIAQALANEFHIIPKNSPPEEWVEVKSELISMQFGDDEETHTLYHLKWRKGK